MIPIGKTTLISRYKHMGNGKLRLESYRRILIDAEKTNKKTAVMGKNGIPMTEERLLTQKTRERRAK